MDIKQNVRQVIEIAIVLNDTELIAMLDDPIGWAEQVRMQVGEHLAQVVAGTATNLLTPPAANHVARKSAGAKKGAGRKAKAPKAPAAHPTPVKRTGAGPRKSKTGAKLQCPYCKQTRKTQATLDKHVRKMHPKESSSK